MTRTTSPGTNEKGYSTEIMKKEGLCLHRLTLPAPAPGFTDFITPWLLHTKQATLLVDPGPSAIIPDLVEVLKDQGVDETDFVLLTHIHIDHAGGIGDFLSAFPNARVVSHPRSFRHLVDPGKLWAGSLQVLGDLANQYGPIEAVPEKALLESAGGFVPGFGVIHTPGHSSHHQSYLYTYGDTKILFAGEAAGVYLGENYLRPATPPRFFFDVAYESLQKLIAVEPTLICYGHFGHTHDTGWLRNAAEQMQLWRRVLQDLLMRDVETAQALSVLEQQDRYLTRRHRFDGQIASRERYFIENSIKGFLQSLSEGT